MEGPWGALTWRSGRLHRVVTSSLAAEGQGGLNCAREVQWASAVLAAMWMPEFSLEKHLEQACEVVAKALVTDCKSLYDLLLSPTGTSSDREANFDALMIREIMRKIAVVPRWAPGCRQLADGLTKEKAEALDALRASLRQGRFNIGDEKGALAARAAERERRLARGRARARANGDATSAE